MGSAAGLGVFWRGLACVDGEFPTGAGSGEGRRRDGLGRRLGSGFQLEAVLFKGEFLFLQGQGSFAQAQPENGQEEGGVLLEDGLFKEEGGGGGFEGGKAGGQVALLVELAEFVQAGGEAVLDALLPAPLEEAGVSGGPAEIDAEAFFDPGDGLEARHGGVEVAGPIDFFLGAGFELGQGRRFAGGRGTLG